MAVSNYDELRSHVGHEVEVVQYGPGEMPFGTFVPANVAVECVTCGCVILDFDHPATVTT